MKVIHGVRRFDLGEIRESSRTPQGFLKVPGFATRVGVFPYMDGDGKIRREFRAPEDVFAPESLETLKYAPVTIEHPPEMITPENVDEYRVGHTTERVEKTDDKVDVDLIIESAEGIDAIEAQGIRELSCGYAADIIEESGEFQGAPYDYRQVNIRYNHLAMVKRGRAGPEVRMRLDSADAIMQGEVSKPIAAEFSQESGVSDSDVEETNAVGEPKQKKLVIAGQEVELPSDVADTIQDLLDRFDEMRAKISQMEESMAKRADKQDVDINQKGVSPQVKVEQQGPDGKSAGGKTPAKPGTITGPVGKADDEEEKDDEDEHGVIGGEKSNSRAEGGKELADDDDDKKDEEEKEDYEAAAGSGAGGAAMSPIDRMKKDIEAVRDAYKDAPEEAMKKLDALEGKLDAYAAASMGKDEKHGDGIRGEKQDSKRNDSISKAIRIRVKLERNAEKLVSFDVAKRFDSMTDDQIRKAVIKHNNPRADLEGKSSDYLQARFDSMCESFEDEDTSATRREAGKRMLGIGSDGEERMDGEEVDPASARLRMVKSGRDEYKSDLSAKKR